MADLNICRHCGDCDGDHDNPACPAFNTNQAGKRYKEKAKADARGLWAVRVLDAWQAANPDAHAFATCYLRDLPIPARKWKCVSFSHPGMFFGPDPDAARIAAATALVAADPSLDPDGVRT